MWTTLFDCGVNPEECGDLTDLAIDSKGTLYLSGADTVLDGGPAPISKPAQVWMKEPGESWQVLASEGTGYGQVLQPTDLTLDAKDQLYVTDPVLHRVMKYNPDLPLLMGDLNLNGEVDISDAVLGLYKIVGLSPAPNPSEMKRGDLYPLQLDGTRGNNEFTLSDVIQILRLAVGLELI